jgi:hypothetical protein
MRVDKRLILLIVFMVMALAVANPAGADPMLSFAPSSSTINVGDPIDVEVKISGLGNYTSPSLSFFDFHINFDPAVLSYSSIVYGDWLNLGDEYDSWTETDESSITAGVLGVYELSYLSSELLGQPGEFTLLTLSFSGNGAGKSTLWFDTTDITVPFGNECAGSLVVDVYGTGAITVVGQIPIPEPGTGTMLLFGIGLIGMGYMHRRKTA